MRRAECTGLSLVELMVALALGLLLIMACGGIYLNSAANAHSTIGVSRTQEAARVAMELIGQDLRGAGDTLCDNRHPVVNLLAQRDNLFWQTLSEPVRGADEASSARVFQMPALDSGTAEAERLAGTESIRLWTLTPLQLSVTDTAQSTQPIPVTGDDTPVVGDALLVCDFKVTTLLRVTATGAAIGHTAPANCVDYFVRGNACAGAMPPMAAMQRYGPDTAMALPEQVRWYVGTGPDQRAALYRSVVRDGKQARAAAIVPGIDSFQLRYLVGGGSRYVTAAEVPDAEWQKVTAVSVRFSVVPQLPGRISDTAARHFQHTYQIRSRG